MGKSLGTDLEKQKPTLPLIRLLAGCTADERRELIEWVASPDTAARERLRSSLERNQAFEYARAKANAYAAAARQEIEQLPESPAREVLLALGEMVVSRQD